MNYLTFFVRKYSMPGEMNYFTFFSENIPYPGRWVISRFSEKYPVPDEMNYFLDDEYSLLMNIHPKWTPPFINGGVILVLNSGKVLPLWAIIPPNLFSVNSLKNWWTAFFHDYVPNVHCINIFPNNFSIFRSNKKIENLEIFEYSEYMCLMCVWSIFFVILWHNLTFAKK